MKAPKSKVIIAPSILAADVLRLGEQVREAESGGAGRIHLDIMDGHFVPNLTFGPLVVKAVRTVTRLTLGVHLMIEEPANFIPSFADAGADVITVQVEACPHLHRVVRQIREAGVRAGVALNPATPACMLTEILPYVDQILVMTVNPGFGGQSFINTMPQKIQAVRQLINRQSQAIDVVVDGGIDVDTTSLVVKTGANVLVAGSAIFKHADGVTRGIEVLKWSAETALGDKQGAET